jgi:sorting nexin-29
VLNRVRWRVKLLSDLSVLLATKKGPRQNNALACMLLHIALKEDNIWDSRIKRSRTVYYKSTQILAYVDDIDIVEVYECRERSIHKSLK